MNVIGKNKDISVEYDNSIENKLVFYLDRFWDDYKKIIVLSSMDVKEYAILLNGVYCDIPKCFKNNNKIICYIIGVDKEDNKTITNKIVIERKNK